MPTDEEANAAISALNGTMLHGYKMNVEVCPENVNIKYTDSVNITVGQQSFP